MPIPTEEWRDFRDKCIDSDEKTLARLASLTSELSHMRRELDDLRKKMEQVRPDLAVLQSQEERRTKRDNTTFGAMLVAIGAAGVAIAAAAVKVWAAVNGPHGR